MALELWCKQDIRNSILAGITMAAAQPDPVLLAGMLIAFRHQAAAFGIYGIGWDNLLQEAACSLGDGGSWLLDVSRGKVLEQI